jgi:hypothetical protein
MAISLSLSLPLERVCYMTKFINKNIINNIIKEKKKCRSTRA